MKTDLTGLSDEARVALIERYVLARLQSRHHGKAEAIGAVDVAGHFKVRDMPAMYERKKIDGVVERGARLNEHHGRIAYFGELLRAAGHSLKARAIAQNIQQANQASQLNAEVAK